MKRLIGLDTETYDPSLKTAGYSWKYNKGYVLNTALYYEERDEVKVIAGLHNDNCPFNESVREKQNEEVRKLLEDPDVCIVGANIQYDIGWLLYEYGMSTFDVKCSFVDVLIAESMLNEFDRHSLEEVSKKYLRYGKSKDLIEEWVREAYPKFRNDFRQKLKDAPWDLLCEYVGGDAKNPVKVWHKQLTLLKEQDLCNRVKLEFDCILPVLQITMNGIPFDNEQRKKNLTELTKYRDAFAYEFRQKYGLDKFNVNSSQNIASFCDAHNIPYKYKITLTGDNGEKFRDYHDTDRACERAKKYVAQFRYEKSKPVAYIPCDLAERTADILKEAGFMFNMSPNVDKKFFASAREAYPEIALIADWKLTNGIISKILGDNYERFVCEDGKIRPQFNTAGALTHRMSSNSPNGQQIPSKGGFKVGDTDVSFPKYTRKLFHAEKGHVFAKIDYGQIEYRLICNIAVGEGSKEVREEFARNPHLDFHQYVVDLTGLTRKYAKNMSFGVSFGMGLKSMANNFGWTIEHAEEISRKYHEHMPFVQPTLELVGDVAKNRGYIKTVCGAHARLKNRNKSYTMLNRFTQEGGAEILKSSIVRAYKEGLWEKLKCGNTVHDELNFPYTEVTEEGIGNVYRMAEIMTTTVPLRVPLEAEPEFGMNWAECRTVSEWVEMRENNPEEWNSQPDELKDAISIAEKMSARMSA